MEKDISTAEASVEEARGGVKKLQKELGKLEAELKSSEVRTLRIFNLGIPETWLSSRTD